MIKFRLQLLRRTLSYWKPENKYLLLSMAATIIAIGSNFYWFLTFDNIYGLINLGAVVFALTVWTWLFRRHLRTIFRIVTGRCIKDIATLQFKLSTSGYAENSRCPICNSSLYPSVIHRILRWKPDPEVHHDKLYCTFCGYEVNNE